MGSHHYVVKGVAFHELPQPCSAQDRFCHVAGCDVSTTVVGGRACLQCRCDKGKAAPLASTQCMSFDTTTKLFVLSDRLAEALFIFKLVKNWKKGKRKAHRVVNERSLEKRKA